MKMLYNFIVE